ncbi:hypothetical protein ACIQ6K_38675 [Streptomyces sp. NPDC096354]|uniref:hypothetical protein n=1 Tax=Streptomyces sp. NPDC096354 TaxID=3366088 RepID=UPI00382015EF
MQPNEIIEVLNRPTSQELLARDVTRLAYVTKDGTPWNVPIAFTWNGSHIVMCTTKNAPNSRGILAHRLLKRRQRASATSIGSSTHLACERHRPRAPGAVRTALHRRYGWTRFAFTDP